MRKMVLAGLIILFSAADITDKDDPGSSSGEKQHQGAPSSSNQSCNDTPTPKQSQTRSQRVPVDDGPQEFVPGKKWEWRDPNKVVFVFCFILLGELKSRALISVFHIIDDDIFDSQFPTNCF